jgi:DNA-binding MarR family transcriptional regulator
MSKPAAWYARDGRFLCLPVAAIRDRRLTLVEIRILLALALHANADGECFPSRTRLSELTGIHETTVSKTTTLLARRGWLRKERGHAGRSNRYYLTIPSEP